MLHELRPEAFRLAESAAAAFSRRDFAAAKQHAQALLLRAPNDTRAHLVLGLVAMEHDRLQAAKQHLERVKTAPPSAMAALNALGGGLLRLGDIDGARETFSRAAERGRSMLGAASAHWNAGRAIGKPASLPANRFSLPRPTMPKLMPR